MKSMLTFSPDKLVNQMIDQNIKNGYVIQIDGKVYVSHPSFEELKQFIVNSADYYPHEGVFWSSRQRN